MVIECVATHQALSEFDVSKRPITWRGPTEIIHHRWNSSSSPSHRRRPWPWSDRVRINCRLTSARKLVKLCRKLSWKLPPHACNANRECNASACRSMHNAQHTTGRSTREPTLPPRTSSRTLDPALSNRPTVRHSSVAPTRSCISSHSMGA
jgi:hypothetical protein